MTSTDFTDTEKLHNLVRHEIDNLNLVDNATYKKMHEKIIAADKHGEISTINRVFISSLEAKNKPGIPPKKVVDLDKANIYVWLAYCLYDEVLDDNSSMALPVSAILIRRAIEIYKNTGLPDALINRFFDEVDNANSEELIMRQKHNTLDHHDLLKLKSIMSRKSITHCIGQVWIVSQCNLANRSSIIEGFYDYCGARQLSDDLYDWRDDFLQGHPTYTTAYLSYISQNKEKSPTKADTLEYLNSAFTSTGLEYLCKLVVSSVQHSIERLSDIMPRGSLYIERFILPLTMSARESIERYTGTLR